MGLVAEEDDLYTVFCTGFEDEPDWVGTLSGETATTCAIGKLTVRVVWEPTSPEG